MGCSSAVSERPSLAQTFEEIWEYHQIEGLRSHARARAKAIGKSTLEMLRLAEAKEKSLTNSENRRGKEGRQPEQTWKRRCGMDPEDALLIFELLARLGKPLRPATFRQMLEAHAIERDTSLTGIDLRTPLKSLMDGPRAEIRKALKERVASLPVDPPRPSITAQRNSAPRLS